MLLDNRTRASEGVRDQGVERALLPAASWRFREQVRLRQAGLIEQRSKPVGDVVVRTDKPDCTETRLESILVQLHWRCRKLFGPQAGFQDSQHAPRAHGTCESLQE